jgi:hypothetical protein
MYPEVANQIKYIVTLWNLNAEENPKNPLQIPVGTFDFVRAGQFGGPENLFGPVESILHPNDRLFGSAAVSCPLCARGRTYWVYIVWGRGGWYWEVPEARDGGMRVPANFANIDLGDFAAAVIAQIPERERVAIKSDPN